MVSRPQWLERLRGRVSRLPGGELTWRIVVGVVGLIVIVVGVILLPLPGPGWVVIFLGLGIWASEFEWAGRLLSWARAQVKGWTDWIARQPRVVQVLVGLVGLLFLAAVAIGVWWLTRQLRG